jgi:hypothetical protein
MEKRTGVNPAKPTYLDPKVSEDDNYHYGFAASLTFRTIRDRPMNEDRIRRM